MEVNSKSLIVENEVKFPILRPILFDEIFYFESKVDKSQLKDTVTNPYIKL